MMLNLFHEHSPETRRYGGRRAKIRGGSHIEWAKWCRGQRFSG
jgi:hypothetical protein